MQTDLSVTRTKDFFYYQVRKQEHGWQKKEFNAGPMFRYYTCLILKEGLLEQKLYLKMTILSHNGEQGSKDNGVWRQEVKITLSTRVM